MHLLTATTPLPPGRPVWFLAHRLIEPPDGPPYLEGVYSHPDSWPRLPGQVWLHAERSNGPSPQMDIAAWQVGADGELDPHPFASWTLPDAWGWTAAITPTLAAHPGIAAWYYPPEAPPEAEAARSKLARAVLAWFIAR